MATNVPSYLQRFSPPTNVIVERLWSRPSIPGTKIEVHQNHLQIKLWLRLLFVKKTSHHPKGQ